MIKRYPLLLAALAALLTLCACGRSPAPAPDVSSSPEPPPSSAPESEPPPSSVPSDAPVTPDPDKADGTERFGGTLSRDGLGFSLIPAEGFVPPDDDPPFRYTRGDAFAEVGYDPSALPEELAPSFMNGYIAFTDIEFSSFSGLGQDGLSADTVAAGDGTTVMTAYLVKAGSGCVWLLFSCPADDAETMRDFDAMRDSFNILEG